MTVEEEADAPDRSEDASHQWLDGECLDQLPGARHTELRQSPVQSHCVGSLMSETAHPKLGSRLTKGDLETRGLHQTSDSKTLAATQLDCRVSTPNR